MLDGYLYKHPNETKKYSFVFTRDVPSGDSIEAVGSNTKVTATDNEGNDATSTIITATSLSGTTLIATLASGVDGMDYTLMAVAKMTTAATTPRKIVELRVRSKIVG